MKILGRVLIEDHQAELIEFLGYEIPDRFSVFLWFSLEDLDDPEGENIFIYEAPFGVKFSYEIGSEGTPNVVEVSVQGAQGERATENDAFSNDFGIYEGFEIRGRVFRHNLGFVEKNFTNILITGLQFVIQHEYTKQDIASKRVISFTTKKIDLALLKEFEREIREEVGKSRKLTPEFLTEVLVARANYKKLKGSHYGFNEFLASKEVVSVKTVEKWIAKAEEKNKGSARKKKVSATKAGKKAKKVVKNAKSKNK